jgi:hypothetical protein
MWRSSASDITLSAAHSLNGSALWPLRGTMRGFQFKNRAQWRMSLQQIRVEKHTESILVLFTAV